MAEQKTDTEDILAHLRGKNKYIFPNMVANLPPEPVQNTVSSCLSPLEVQATVHRIAHIIENHHRWPGQLKDVLYILLELKVVQKQNEPPSPH